ncbi:hypothetical protein [Pseudonocardia sp. DLS-67]
MSDYVAPAKNISDAWLLTLQLVHEGGGRRTNVLTTVCDPTAPEDPEVRGAIDAILIPGKRQGVHIQTVDTVANTIFPQELYNAPDVTWAPDIDPEEALALDAAAAQLYETYVDMLPVLRTVQANSRGTYFGRMVSWPGKTAGGINQLAERVDALRAEHRAGRSRYNLADITIGGQAEAGIEAAATADAPDDVGLQLYAADDRRPRGFPCLVHVDLTLLDGRLSMLAVYRHQYLVTKAYGNLVGLARLLAFLAQQTGFAVGELVVAATLADAEESTFGGRRGIDALIRSAQRQECVG